MTVPNTRWPHGRDYLVHVAGPSGGYIDRKGQLTTDRGKAYLFSRKGAELYITENKERFTTAMTLEEAPK